MTELPSGIVAFLMTDVERSTQEWNRSGPEMESSMAALDADIAAIVDAHVGTLVKARGEGDSHFGAFATASAAVAAAAAIQRRPDDRLVVRGAVLIGEAVPRDGDYVGGIINHGARLRSAAHGGQVLVTRAVVDLAVPDETDDLSFRPLGPHRLRDVPAPIDLHQLCGSGLRASFPPQPTEAFSATAMMAVVIVDEAGSTRRLEQADPDLVAWQGALIRSLRDAAERHSGRFVKLMGDGCLVGFEDPRQALAFVAELPDRCRAGIATGLVDVVEGELIGRTVFDAHQLMLGAAPGEVRTCGVTTSLCARAH